MWNLKIPTVNTVLHGEILEPFLPSLGSERTLRPEDAGGPRFPEKASLFCTDDLIGYAQNPGELWTIYKSKNRF